MKQRIAMKQDTLDAWLAALRHPDVKQGREYLQVHDENTGDDRFCCLGVLCRLEGHECGDNTMYYSDGYFAYSHSMARDTPPLGVMLNHLDDADRQRIGANRSTVAQALATFNDEGWTFREIADWIETHLEGRP